MNRDELKGKARTVKGKVKQVVGTVTDNPNLYAEGVADERAGRVQGATGAFRRKVGNAVKDLGNVIKK
jgi:uncharacterized protein YjbJ (UPF0337 family)